MSINYYLNSKWNQICTLFECKFQKWMGAEHIHGDGDWGYKMNKLTDLKCSTTKYVFTFWIFLAISLTTQHTFLHKINFTSTSTHINCSKNFLQSVLDSLRWTRWPMSIRTITRLYKIFWYLFRCELSSIQIN